MHNHFAWMWKSLYFYSTDVEIKHCEYWSEKEVVIFVKAKETDLKAFKIDMGSNLTTEIGQFSTKSDAFSISIR